MKRIHCTQCGANLKKNEDGDYCCDYCGSVYKSKREKGKVFVKDSYYKFNKDDTERDIEKASQNSKAEFTYKKIKPYFTFIPIIIFIVAIILATVPPLIIQSIEDNTPQTIKYIASGNGFLKVNGELVKEYTCELKKGQSITVEAIPDENYKFSRWNDNKTNVTRVDEKNEKEAQNYIAYFVEKNKYTLRYNSYGGGYIEGETIQTVYEFGSGTPVTAVPNPGYYFTGWSDGYSGATRTDAFVKNNINVHAEFYNPFESGLGTESDPYIITSTEHFLNIEDTADGCYFKLNSDLDFSNVSALDWSGFEFNGHLDGNNHTIKNLKYALFTSLTSAEVKNIVIHGAMVDNTIYKNSYAGILTNSVSGDVKITNCIITNSRLGLQSSGVNHLGFFVGLIKKNSTVVIDGCELKTTTAQSMVNIRDTKPSSMTFVTGGIVGYVESGVTLELKNNNINGTLTVYSSIGETTSNIIYAGGLIGYISSGCFIKMSDNVASTALRHIGSRTLIYLGDLVGGSFTQKQDITLTANDATMGYSETGMNNEVIKSSIK